MAHLSLQCACIQSSGPLPVRNEEGPIPPHIANRQAPARRYGSFAPWILEGKPGILTPSEDFKSGEIYGFVHGVGATSGSGVRVLAEQWFLSKEGSDTPLNGVK